MTRNFVVLYKGDPVAHLQRGPGGLLLSPGKLNGDQLAKLGLALENLQLPEGFELVAAKVASRRANNPKPNWKELARRAREQRKNHCDTAPTEGRNRRQPLEKK